MTGSRSSNRSRLSLASSARAAKEKASPGSPRPVFGYQFAKRSLPLALSLAASIVAFESPALAEEPTRDERFDPSAYPPEGTQSNTIIAGAITTGAWYGTAVGFSYLFPDAPGARDLRIPIAGPWMALADTGCASDDPGCSTFSVVLRAILTVIDGVGQVGGLAIIAEGLFVNSAPATSGPRAPQPKTSGQSLERSSLLQGANWSAQPLVGSDVLGLGVFGQF